MAYKFSRLFADSVVLSTAERVLRRLVKNIATAGLLYALSEDGITYSCIGIGDATDTDIIIADTVNGALVTSITSHAFDGCSNLTSIAVSDSVHTIDSMAFYNCTNLTKVTIPDSVKVVNSNVFEGCSNLVYNEYGGMKFIGNDDNPYSSIIKYADRTITSFEVPSTTKSMGGAAFYGCSKLMDITFAEGIQLEVISYGAFQQCKFTSITLPTGVKVIDNRAFYKCASLTSVILPSTLTTIGHSVFYSCEGLTSFVVPNNVTSIGGNAFDGCTSLTSVTLPASLTYLGTYVFQDCAGLGRLTYSGTKAMWNAIEKDPKWNSGSSIFTIECLDGSVSP